jgi:hypothetical protein
MGSVQQLRNLLRLAATLRSYAADASSPDYARRLLAAAMELEAQAEFLSSHYSGEDPQDLERDAALHAPVDLKI